VSLYDWLLFLHVLAAFALVAAVVAFTAMLLASDPAVLRLTPLARRLWDVGGGGTIVFGIWLALNRPEYELWDGWVIVALVLWVIAAGAGIRLGSAYASALAERRSPPRAAAPYGVMTLATAALLADMVFKPWT
jgi:uncharacterized membrane protein